MGLVSGLVISWAFLVSGLMGWLVDWLFDGNVWWVGWFMDWEDAQL